MFAGATRRPAVALAAAVGLVLALAACRTAVPVFGGSEIPEAHGTVTGQLRGPDTDGDDDEAPVAGRRVHVVNVATGERQSMVTSETGGFTFQVTPGRYRMEVELLPGERLLEDVDSDGEFTVSASELQHDVVLRVGSGRAAALPIYQPPLPTGAPIA